jgi:hypothetical protein
MPPRFHVEWSLLSAEEHLPNIFLTHPDRQADLVRLTNHIDASLGRAPLDFGESRSGATRVWFLEFLVVHYEVILDDTKVLVLSVHAR